MGLSSTTLHALGVNARTQRGGGDPPLSLVPDAGKDTIRGKIVDQNLIWKGGLWIS